MTMITQLTTITQTRCFRPSDECLLKYAPKYHAQKGVLNYETMVWYVWCTIPAWALWFSTASTLQTLYSTASQSTTVMVKQKHI